MVEKEVKLKVAEAIQEYENQRFSIVQQVGHDVNKGSENQRFSGLYLRVISM